VDAFLIEMIDRCIHRYFHPDSRRHGALGRWA
jgi:hypothetical protein